MPRKIFIIATLLILFLGIKQAHAVFEVDTDSINIDFGFLNIGEWKELEERGAYQNEITCTSDTGNIWYLKIHALDDFRSGTETMDSTNLKWKVIMVIGGNGIITNQSTFTDLQTSPQVVYTSGPGDSAGNAIKIRMAYAISIPKAQSAGNYRATIRYTFTELL